MTLPDHPPTGKSQAGENVTAALKLFAESGVLPVPAIIAELARNGLIAGNPIGDQDGYHVTHRGHHRLRTPMCQPECR